MSSALEAFTDGVYDLLDIIGMPQTTIPRGLEDVVIAYIVELTLDPELSNAVKNKDFESLLDLVENKSKYSANTLRSKVITDIYNALWQLQPSEVDEVMEIAAELIKITEPLKEAAPEAAVTSTHIFKT